MTWISDATRRVREVNEANGWFDHNRTFGDGLMLITTEVGEAYEAFRQWGLRDTTYDHAAHLSTCNYDVVLGTGNCSCPPHAHKPEGVGSEMADILVRLLDECDRQDIDLETEFERKLAFNATRGYHHGGKSL